MSASGVGGSSHTPEKVPGLGATTGVGSENVGDLLHTKVATLGELKAVLVQSLGEHQGTKFYNMFIQSFAMIMLQQIQSSAAQAKKAAQDMRMGNP